MRLTVEEITRGWASRPDATPAHHSAPSAATELAGTQADALTRSLMQALGNAVDALAEVSLEHGLASIEQAVVIARRQIDAMEGEVARLTHVLATHSLRPRTGPRSTTAEIARRAACAQRRITVSVHIGQELDSHGDIGQALRAGDVSLDNARLLAEVADVPGFDAAAPLLLEAARELTPSRLRHVIDGWLASIPAVDAATTDNDADRPFVPSTDSELARRRRHSLDRRFLSFSDRRHGLTRITADVPTVEIAGFSRTLNDIASLSADDESGRTWPQRMADALVEWATLTEGRLSVSRHRPVVVVTRGDSLDGFTYAPSHSGNGQILTDTDVAHTLCIGESRVLTLDERGSPLHLGRRRRTFTTSQYLALVRRDGRCRYPGCETPADRCEAHHIREYLADDGPTDLDNGLLLCPTHHRHLHRERERFVGHPERDLELVEAGGRRRPANLALVRFTPHRHLTARAKEQSRIKRRALALAEFRPRDGTSRARPGPRHREGS